MFATLRNSRIAIRYLFSYIFIKSKSWNIIPLYPDTNQNLCWKGGYLGIPCNDPQLYGRE